MTKGPHKQVNPWVEANEARRASQPLTQSRRLELSCRWISLYCSTVVLRVVVFLACCDVSRLTGTVSRFLGYHEELLEVCGPSVGFSVVLPDHKSDERIVQKGDVIKPLGSPCTKQWLLDSQFLMCVFRNNFHFSSLDLLLTNILFLFFYQLLGFYCCSVTLSNGGNEWMNESSSSDNAKFMGLIPRKKSDIECFPTI